MNNAYDSGVVMNVSRCLVVFALVGFGLGCSGDGAVDQTEPAEPDEAAAADEPVAQASEEPAPMCELERLAAGAPACPRSSDEICAKIGYACGTTFAEIGCDGTVDAVSCGACADGFQCRDGSCACRAEYECGDVQDECGATVSCGTCEAGFTCSDHVCVCDREPDAMICERLEVECGSVAAHDFCGNEVLADCGGCDDGICGQNQCRDLLAVTPAGSLADAMASSFGLRVAAAEDSLFVAAPGAGRQGEAEAGVVQVFRRAPGGAFTAVQLLMPDSAAADDRFGARVAVSDDATIVAVVNRGRSQVQLFRREGAQYIAAGAIDAAATDGLAFGRDIAIGETHIAVASTPSGDDPAAGRVDLYRLDGGFARTISAPDGLSTDAAFGQAVAFDDDAIWVAADRAEVDGMSDVGVVFRYENADSQPERFEPNDARSGQRFGHRLAFTADTLLVSSHLDGDDVDAQGAVYVFAHEGGAWRQIQQLHAPQPAEDGRFGHAISAFEDRLFVGAYGAEQAYLFKLDLDYRWKLDRQLRSAADDGSWFGFRGAVTTDAVIVAAPRAGQVFAY